MADLLIRNLDEATLDHLKRLAISRGQSVEDLARDMLAAPTSKPRAEVLAEAEPHPAHDAEASDRRQHRSHPSRARCVTMCGVVASVATGQSIDRLAENSTLLLIPFLLPGRG